MGMPKWIIEFKFLSGPERERGSTSHSLFYLLPPLIPFDVRVEGRERETVKWQQQCEEARICWHLNINLIQSKQHLVNGVTPAATHHPVHLKLNDIVASIFSSRLFVHHF